MSENEPGQQLSEETISMLRCPLTRSRLRREGDYLVAEVGGLRYPVRDGIPVMLAEEARLPEPFKTLDEFKVHLRQHPGPG
jgi:uncharacterized protein